MKAQMVKNAVIVPVGAKGGFVVKRPPRAASARTCCDEVEACYRTFIRGLLDVTDNIAGGETVPPPDVVRYDDDDPYLVVAADKGTATFSDIANAIAAEYGFWLGDAFASGGVARLRPQEDGHHRRAAPGSRSSATSASSGHDVQTAGLHRASASATCRATCSATACCSRAAHPARRRVQPPRGLPRPRPRPDGQLRRSASACSSCRARRGPTTTSDLISDGGGVLPRTAKSIPLSPQAREALDVDELGADAERADPRAAARRRSTCSGTAASAPT